MPESLDARLFFSVLLLLFPPFTAAMLLTISWPRLSDLQVAREGRDTTFYTESC